LYEPVSSEADVCTFLLRSLQTNIVCSEIGMSGDSVSFWCTRTHAASVLEFLACQNEQFRRAEM
jgi:hypothetical protein